MITLSNIDKREGRAFYVTVRNADKTGYLLGPYDSHEEALANVDRGRELAEQVNHWAHFYAFGTGSLPMNLISLPKAVFGK